MSHEQNDSQQAPHGNASDSDARAAHPEPMGGDPPCWVHLFGEDPGLAAEDLNEPVAPEPSDRPGREPHDA